MGSIWMRPNGGLSSSGTQNMQSSTGQYSTQAGDPAQPVQHSVMTASSFGFFFRAVTMPFERGSCFSSSGTIPGAFSTSGALAMSCNFTLNVKPLSVWLLSPVRCCYNARAIRFMFGRTHVPQVVLQTYRTRIARRTRVAPLLHLAFPLLFRRYRLLRRACSQLAVPPRLRLLLKRAASSLRCARARLSRISGRHLFPGRNRPEGSHAGTSFRRPRHVRLGRGCCRWSGRGHSRRVPRARCRGGALAHCPLSFHRQLRRCTTHGSPGDVFHHARAFNLSVASGNANKPHRLEPRSARRRESLVRRRVGYWSRYARPAGNATASCRRPDSALAPLWSSCELERTHGRNVVDDRWSVAAVGALGRPQCGQSWTRAVPRPSLRGNVRRRPADRLLRLDENLDVSFSRRLSIHLETALAANRLEQSAFLRSGLCRRIFTRRFPAGSLQPRPRDDPHIRSRVCRIGTRTRKASSDSYLCIDSHRTRRGDVVYSTDYPATLFRPTLASRRKSSQQSHRLRGHARLGAAQCLVYCTGSGSRVVLAPESWSFVDRGLRRPAHRIPYSTADL